MNTETNEIKNVCVFAGSSPGGRGIYSETAKELAQKLTDNNFGIVYGGGSNGLMGILGDKPYSQIFDTRMARFPDRRSRVDPPLSVGRHGLR